MRSLSFHLVMAMIRRRKLREMFARGEALDQMAAYLLAGGKQG